jgi:hypothetical protein
MMDLQELSAKHFRAKAANYLASPCWPNCPVRLASIFRSVQDLSFSMDSAWMEAPRTG